MAELQKDFEKYIASVQKEKNTNAEKTGQIDGEELQDVSIQLSEMRMSSICDESKDINDFQVARLHNNDFDGEL